MEYGREQAVADGVNDGFDLDRIRTRITEGGATPQEWGGSPLFTADNGDDQGGDL